MTTPTTNVYVRPGWTSYTWSYSGASIGASPVTAVAFSLDSAWSQQVGRGDFQYSVDGGRTWTTYVLQGGSEGAYLPAGAMWRFADHMPDDAATAGSVTMHWKLADGSIVASSAAVLADEQPVGLVTDGHILLSTLHGGDAVAALAPIDSGAPDGGRWVIEGQSQPGLFSVAVDAATGAAHLVVADPAAIPPAGQGVTVSVHYYDRYQLDSDGNPIAGTGVADTLAFSVVQGTSVALPGFGADLSLGAASGLQAAPAVASLSTGGFVTVWQGGGAAIWAQVRDAAGNPAGSPFLVTPALDAASGGEPAVGALPGGRFAVAYTIGQNGASMVAYRIVGADGSVGEQVVAGAADASMPALATLADGSFVLGWRSGGQVHTLHASASGAVIGAEQVFGALGTAYSPELVALHNGDFALAWGEIGDGNVYMALGGSGRAQQVTADGAAASISTAAPLAHVTALAGGGFVVAWDSYSNDQLGFSVSDIFFQRYDNAGNALGPATQANIDSGGGRYDAPVAALADGGFVIAWQSQAGDGDANGVFGRRFGADGAAIDVHEFAVNQQAQGDQSGPAVAATASGGFVTAWVDTQHGASTIEVRVLAGTGGGNPDTGLGGGSGGSSAPLPAPIGTAPGNATPLQLDGTSAANVFTPGAGSHAIDGGAGLDTVLYQGAHSAYQLTVGASGLSVSSTNGSLKDTLLNVERVQFGDVSVALDIAGTAGQAYRLYQAAFDRTPDQTGMGFWIRMMDSGQTLDQVAAGFVTSKEFADLYGANASNSQFVQALYQNVLHRQAEAGGYDFWMAAIEQHGVARATVLGGFSESLENQAQVIGSIQDGIAFLPWG
jgi:Domain of unknown function (DUF4214)